MKTDTFPLNYFQAMVSPQKTFYWRDRLNWFQSIIIYIFLTALLLIPVTLNLAKQDHTPAAEFMPHAQKLLTDEVAQEFANLHIQDGQLSDATTTIFNETADSIIGVELTEEVWSAHQYGIDFRGNEWRIKERIEGKEYQYTLRYSRFIDPTKAKDGTALREMLEQDYFANNRSALILIKSFTTGFLLFAMNILLVLGAAFFLWLTKRSRLSSIRNFHESLNVILASLGIGTVLAAVIGCFYFDVTLMLGVQSIAMVAMLFATYVKTKFKDK